jgi:hypothetical protein
MGKRKKKRENQKRKIVIPANTLEKAAVVDMIVA